MGKWVEQAKKAGISFVIFPANGLNTYWEGVKRMIGKEGEAVLAYDSGKEAVREMVRVLRREWKLNGREFVKAAEEFFSELGMGELSIELPKIGLPRRKKFVFRIRNSYIARSVSERSDEPVCHLFRGYAAGIMEELTGWKMDAEETKCLAMGDEYCEFVVRRVEPVT